MTNDDWLWSEPWYGLDAYIIGGGSSLENFNWSLLEKLNTIGCNDAYKLGQKICKICIFGDKTWWDHHSKRLEEYSGLVVTNACGLASCNLHWVHYIGRSHNCFHKSMLCWAGNTGVAAINLALILGAKNVFLLGFDMGKRAKKTNWHDEIIHPGAVLPSSYKMFLDRWDETVDSLYKTFPNSKVINVNDDSKLRGIESISVKEFWKDTHE